ncbi:MAG: hypothetical protein M3R62_15770 [Acidobacteriota bacterium]|jgi:hypothetical protein|nr:hypothetical protein [Acidobacteriota bacterium]MDQ2980667.1 hypothetical protein [Acidobacteriota bacterium]HXM77761.1 hypothetical protein [Thermoanaerobaculia bacterium]
MEQGNADPPGERERERAIVNELRELGRSFSALGKTVFEEGRVLSADLLRSAREAVDRARQEIEKMARERR